MDEKKKIFLALEKLNKAVKEDDKTKLFEEAVDINSAKKLKEEGLREFFLSTVESVSESDEDFIPVEVQTLYNEIVEADAGEPEEENQTSEKKSTKQTKNKKEETEVKKTVKKETKTEVKKEETKTPKTKGKKRATGGESNKAKIYKAWQKDKKASADKLAKIAPDIALTTVKIWLKRWAKGTGLPKLK